MRGRAVRARPCGGRLRRAHGLRLPAAGLGPYSHTVSEELRHTIYIRTSPEQLWAALTDGEVSFHYLFETEIRSSFAPGEALAYMVVPEDEEPGVLVEAVRGKVLSVEIGRVLEHSFAFVDLDEPPSTLRWQLRPGAGPGVVRVDLVHRGLVPHGGCHQRVVDGWPIVLSGLKTWLETGEPLGVAGFGGASD